MTKKPRLLITEDTNDISAGIASVMSAQNFDVTVVPRDGRKALELLRGGNRFDAALIDLNMIHFDAIELMRQLGTSSKIKIMIMAPSISGGLEREIHNAGGKYIFVKPFDYKVAAARILSLLQYDDIETRPEPVGRPVTETEVE